MCSSFCAKAKKKKKWYWEVAIKNSLFVVAFAKHGVSLEPWKTGNLTLKYVCWRARLSRRVCLLHIWFKKEICWYCWSRYVYEKKSENKVIDLSNMPPCFSSLLLNLQRANYVPRIWKLILYASLALPGITDHGWDEDGRIKWIQQPLVDDITELLMFDNDIDDNSENNFED